MIVNSKKTSQVRKSKSPTPAAVNLSVRSKIILICLGAIFVLIPIGAYILGTKQIQPSVKDSAQVTPTPSPTPDPTANWATFVNEKYGFEIKYPERWQISQYKSDNTFYISNVDLDKKYREASKNIPVDGAIFNGISISIFESGMTLESFIESYYNNPNSPYGKTIESTKNVKFPNGMPAIFVKSNTSRNDLGSSTLIKFKNYIFKFTKYYGGSAGIERYRDQQFDEILATFRFTS